MNLCYQLPDKFVQPQFYEKLKQKFEQQCTIGGADITQTLVVPKKSARCIFVKKGSILRISCVDGPQAGDLNFWNANNFRERFYTGKTRQLHRSHLSMYDKLWSCFPYLNPMATIIGDSIMYGIDEDGGGIHDVIGTRCDPFTHSLMNGGKIPEHTCHQNLVHSVDQFINQNDDSIKALIRKAFSDSDLDATKRDDVTNQKLSYQITKGICMLQNIQSFRIDFTEETRDQHIHDVLNIFMLSGFTRDEGKYFVKPSPAKKGDYIDIYAEMDLLVGLSACPQGDVSIPCGEPVPDEICHRLKMEVFKVDLHGLKRANST